jgi:threonine dehydrogenase-like Zn-dependent dehydrogenase
MKMKAAIYYGPGDIKVEEIDRPQAKDGYKGMGMVVKIRACGICNVMDLPRYQRTILGVGTGIAHGHEWSGDVVEVGPNVTDVRVGDRVWGRSFLPCGECAACRAGNYVGCTNFIRGMTGRWLNGAFAEYMLFPYVKEDPSILVKLADDVTYRDGALIEPMRLCLGLAAKVKTGDVVVIIGQQFMGLATLARLKKSGVAKKLIVSDVSPKRLEKARELGADVVVDELNEDLAEVVMEETAGDGAHVVIDTAARPNSFQQAIDVVRPGRPDGGTIWLTQPYDAPFMFNPSLQRPESPTSSITGKSGISIRNPWGTLGNGEMHTRSMEFIQTGAINAEKVVTHVYPLDKIKEAFETALHSPEAIKVVVEP